MSERWWKRKKKERPPWFSMFDEFDRLEKMMDEMMNQAFKTSSERRTYGPYVYGFSMSTGADGKPVIREFGNVRRSHLGPEITEEREPLVDIIEENEAVVVVAEVPGVEKDDINLYTACDRLVISVDTPKRRFRKELKLPTKVDPACSEVSCRNGVLEIRLKKLQKESDEKIFNE